MRFKDWPVRLDQVVVAARQKPFAWGRHDCCLFAADCVQAITGTDPAADYRGRYRSRLGATRALRRLGAADMVDAVTRALGTPLGSPLLAAAGDVALVYSEGSPALGVVLGRKIAAAAPDGLATLSLTAALTAWRV